jgi:prepilin-type N-terminal cleavage/methylation domain-containing protein
MKRLLMQFRHGQRGFTLIELLIVVAILGILAAVVLPNVTGFFTTGTLNAANTELENVRTAGMAYYAENAEWPPTNASTDLVPDFITGGLKAEYTWDVDGLITGTLITDGWDGIEWNGGAGGHWVRGAATP